MSAADGVRTDGADGNGGIRSEALRIANDAYQGGKGNGTRPSTKGVPEP